MERNFPEITTFGTLLNFALALEEIATDLTSRAADRKACEAHRERLATIAKKHRKHGIELQRLRQERLNEVVLQSVSGMDRAAYLPPQDLPEESSDCVETLNTVLSLEETVARFHEEASNVAANMLPGVDRKLKKLAAECREYRTLLER